MTGMPTFNSKLLSIAAAQVTTLSWGTEKVAVLVEQAVTQTAEHRQVRLVLGTTALIGSVVNVEVRVGVAHLAAMQGRLERHEPS